MNRQPLSDDTWEWIRIEFTLPSLELVSRRLFELMGDPEPVSRGGDRQANSALHHVVLSRMQSDHRTKDYVAKRTADGKSKRETMRCLKRYVAREIFRQIFNPVAAPDITDLRTVRKQLGVTLQQAAEQLSQWPSNLSRIERGIARNDHVAERYRQWLAQQQLSPSM